MSSLQLRAQRVSFSYTDAVPVLSDAEFHLSPGWTGLVGANGAGKSTLLRLLSGELSPTEGGLRLEPRSAVVRLCAQSVEVLEPDIRALADSTGALARRILGELRLDPAELDRWPTLSPGERKRWQIGAALAAEPEVLLLDEPTNHLDAEARAWLISALRRFRGIGVLVSHDRTLLDALTQHTLRVHAGSVRLWPGSYAAARREWEAEAGAKQAAREAAKEEHQRAQRHLADVRRNRQAAEADFSTGRRMRNKYDSDARGMGADFRVRTAEKRLGRSVGVARRQAERAAEAVEEFEVEKTLGRSVFVGYERAPKPWLFVQEVPPLSVGREDRIWIEGPNGGGKTTLVRALLEQAKVPLDRVLYLPQDLEASEASELLDEVRALPEDERGRVLSLVAALGVDPQRLLASEQPSPGEARKLCIALGMGRHAWALVLDEPTNHLDLPSIERLQAALASYPGALVLVTHDEAFARACTTARWHVAGGKVDVGG